MDSVAVWDESAAKEIYRGIRKKRGVFEALKKGDIFDLKSPSSFSSSYKVAEDFATKLADGEGVILRVKGNIVGSSVTHVSKFGMEEEEILTSGRNILVILGKEKRGNILFVDCELKGVKGLGDVLKMVGKNIEGIIKKQVEDEDEVEQTPLIDRWAQDDDEEIVIYEIK